MEKPNGLTLVFRSVGKRTLGTTLEVVGSERALLSHQAPLSPSLFHPDAGEMLLLRSTMFRHNVRLLCQVLQQCAWPRVNPDSPEPRPQTFVAEAMSHRLLYGDKATRGSRGVRTAQADIHLPLLTLENRTEREESSQGSCSTPLL